MEQCQLQTNLRKDLRKKLEEIRQRVEEVMKIMNGQQGCMLCEIKSIREAAGKLEGLISYYHFQSSLMPYVEKLDEIAKAVASLSEKGHGALIVVEKNDMLDSLIGTCSMTGILIGAKISAPLLQSIFYPGNPLHDGAVIIRKGQIVAAGCVLPLSAQKYTSERHKIGTRHRAALGLSERTDALVIVVSEETGQISFAKDGVLHPIDVQLCTKLQQSEVNHADSKQG